MKKDYCPGYYDLATGGVVGDGEEDDVNAMREVHEEVGIDLDISLFNKIQTSKFDDERSRVFRNVYILKDLDFDITSLTLQADEVDGVELWSRDKILAI